MFGTAVEIQAVRTRGVLNLFMKQRDIIRMQCDSPKRRREPPVSMSSKPRSSALAGPLAVIPAFGPGKASEDIPGCGALGKTGGSIHLSMSEYVDPRRPAKGS